MIWDLFHKAGLEKTQGLPDSDSFEFGKPKFRFEL